ncbi:MAG: type II toxin-antitoxin system PemK/MazF family toxin [Lachnospiraceae bacterium]|nr:type II toxin-antitoxin system PemK/MazF family toxin [Lachnospiraceae bacterium]
MRMEVHQGDVLKIENISVPVLVASKDFFNKTGEIVGCPVYKNGKPGALSIKVQAKEIEGFVQCEKLSLLDLRVRGHSKIDRISMAEIIDITDAIQGIFDY